jgi:hypothetical protein
MCTEQENVNCSYFISFTFWNLNYVTDIHILLFTAAVPPGSLYFVNLFIIYLTMHFIRLLNLWCWILEWLVNLELEKL